jgi:putative sterol carrier protein
MKKTGTVYKGEAKPRPDVTIILADDVFVELATGKVSEIYASRICVLLTALQLNGQKAFMTGQLKTKGNMMLATKLDDLLQVRSVSPHVEQASPDCTARRAQRPRLNSDIIVPYH